MGWLSTHVLDTANGCPAVDMEVMLYHLRSRFDNPSGQETLEQTAESGRRLIKAVRTNHDGRTDAPMLSEAEFEIGQYELAFAVGDYFSRKPISPENPLSSPHLFLDWVPIRFGMSDPDAHYHVPLLVSPWSYSTYRGS